MYKPSKCSKWIPEVLVQPTVSWLKIFSTRGKASGLAGYGWISKYEALNSLHNLQCHIQLRLQVRNGLGLKYRVLCSRHWPHLGQFSNLHNLQCHIQLRPQVRNGLFEFQGIFFIPTRRISNKYKSASQIFCTTGSINFGRIFIIYAPNESSWKSSITKYHS